MLVLSREAGSSLKIDSADTDCLITVLKLFGKRMAISVVVSQVNSAGPGKMETKTFELAIDDSFKIGDAVEITLLDVRAEMARIAILAPKEAQVHRLEVYEAIKEAQRKAEKYKPQDPDEGLAGSRVPRPTKPAPPTLDVRLDEPRAENGSEG